MAVRDANGIELEVGDRVRLTGTGSPAIPREVGMELGEITEITRQLLVRVRLDIGYPLKKPIPPFALTKITRKGS